MFFYFYNLENFSVLVFAISVLLPIALFLFFGIMLGRMKNSMYVDYDYTYVSGSIRISKIIRKIKRKNTRPEPPLKTGSAEIRRYCGSYAILEQCKKASRIQDAFLRKR